VEGGGHINRQWRGEEGGNRNTLQQAATHSNTGGRRVETAACQRAKVWGSILKC